MFRSKCDAQIDFKSTSVKPVICRRSLATITTVRKMLDQIAPLEE